MLTMLSEQPRALASFEDASARHRLVEALVQFRKQSGIRQTQVAELMGTTQSAISDLELGRVDPRLSTIQRYARAVGKRLEGRIASASKDPDEEFVEHSILLAEETGVQEVLEDLYSVGADELPQTVSSIAERTGLPRVAIDRTTERLLATRWLRATPPSGEPTFAFKRDRGLVAGIRLTGHHVHGVMTDLKMSRVISDKHEKLLDRTPKGVVRAIASMIREFQGEVGEESDLAGFGVSLAGRVDGERGTIYNAVDFEPVEGWKGFELEDELQRVTKLRAVVENDANALAIQEHLADPKRKSLAVVLLAQRGVGAGILNNGEILHGSHGISGEIGHIPLKGETGPCRCGGIGCLETVASVTSIVSAVQKRTRLPVGDLEQVAALAEQVNKDTRYVLARAGSAVGRVMYAMTAIAGTTSIRVIGPAQLTDDGKHASAGRFMNSLKSEMRASLLGADIAVTSGALDVTVECRAAAATAVYYLLSRPRRWLNHTRVNPFVDLGDATSYREMAKAFGLATIV